MPFPEDNEESGDNKPELRSSFLSHPPAKEKRAKEKCCSDNFDKRASGQKKLWKKGNCHQSRRGSRGRSCNFLLMEQQRWRPQLSSGRRRERENCSFALCLTCGVGSTDLLPGLNKLPIPIFHKGAHTELRKSLGTWLREISSCSCLTFLPGPAWVLLSKICIYFFSALYTWGRVQKIP